eukprot:Filipodium_phascolosomae@DN7847_c0_g1_i1.p1
MAGFFTRFHEQYAELWRAIIRPPRDIYEIRELGATRFELESRKYQRSDFVLVNKRGQRLVCSHFEPVEDERICECLPCVIYLHGNCSSRMEALGCLPSLLPQDITVVSFDFSGSGLSDGEWVTLGWYEREDLEVVIHHLRENRRVGAIGLWGRSMGAATALLHRDEATDLAGYVLDSPFCSLRKLAEELVDNYVNFKIPRFLFGTALGFIRTSIQSRAHFDINQLNPIDHVADKYPPAMFIAANDDMFIRSHHAQELHDAFGGDKRIMLVEGDHNSIRSQVVMDSVATWFYNCLRCENLESLRRRHNESFMNPSLSQSLRSLLPPPYKGKEKSQEQKTHSKRDNLRDQSISYSFPSSDSGLIREDDSDMAPLVDSARGNTSYPSICRAEPFHVNGSGVYGDNDNTLNQRPDDATLNSLGLSRDEYEVLSAYERDVSPSTFSSQPDGVSACASIGSSSTARGKNGSSISESRPISRPRSDGGPSSSKINELDKL